MASTSMPRYGNKALALSMADTVGVAVGFSSPFVGSLSDRLPERWARRFGRRRPFVVAGSTLMLLGVWLTYYSLYFMKGAVGLRAPRSSSHPAARLRAPVLIFLGPLRSLVYSTGTALERVRSGCCWPR